MNLKEKVRSIQDFPVPGVRFHDITTLLKDGAAYKEMVDRMLGKLKDIQIDVVAGPEARGFLLGAPMAYSLGAGFVPVRRPGKLPWRSTRTPSGRASAWPWWTTYWPRAARRRPLAASLRAWAASSWRCALPWNLPIWVAGRPCSPMRSTRSSSIDGVKLLWLICWK